MTIFAIPNNIKVKPKKSELWKQSLILEPE
nr:MAG TPA: hypothetical protein [Caudoviricetes sp.]